MSYSDLRAFANDMKALLDKVKEEVDVGDISIGPDIQKSSFTGNAKHLAEGSEDYVAILITSTKGSVEVRCGGMPQPITGGPHLFVVTFYDLCILRGSFILNLITKIT